MEEVVSEKLTDEHFKCFCGETGRNWRQYPNVHVFLEFAEWAALSAQQEAGTPGKYPNEGEWATSVPAAPCTCLPGHHIDKPTKWRGRCCKCHGCQPPTAPAPDALDGLYRDPHQWSQRPCETCANLSKFFGYDFGCVRFAKERAALRAKGEK
jgi:hypothetical protein